MKRTAKIFMGIAMASTLIATTGCFGNFALTRKVYAWNDSLAGDDIQGKLVKSLIMWGLNIIPVYPISAFADMIIFNLIEFWTGSNPLAMVEGQEETQIVERQGIQYKITATKNSFEVTQMSGAESGKVQSFEFNTADLTWVSTKEGISSTLIQYQIENNEIVSATYFAPNGQSNLVTAAELNKTFVGYAAR